MDPQLGERVEGRAAGQDPYGSGLALAGSGTDKPVRLKQGDADGPPAGVGAERNRGEHVGLAGLEQGPRRGLGLGDVVETDPQLQAPGVLAWHWRWPGSRQGTAQARGQRLTAGEHLGRGDAVRQVELHTPAGAVAMHVGDERDPPAVLHGLVDFADADAGQRAGDDLRRWRLVPRRDDRGPDNRLVVGPAVADHDYENLQGEDNPGLPG